MKDSSSILSLLPETTHLHYVDYRDSLENLMESVQESIQDNNYDAIQEAIDDLHWDDHDQLEEYRTDLKKKLCKMHPEEFVNELIEENRDEIDDELRARDQSTILSDLVNNTGKIICFYDTGYEVGSDTWQWTEAQIRHERQRIKSELNLLKSGKKYNKDIEEMIENATYGGKLVVYFRDKINCLIQSETNGVEFKNATVAIIDTYGGSGHSAELIGTKFSLPLNRQNIFVEKTIKYSFTYEVCGMSEDWCDSTVVKWVNRKRFNNTTVKTSDEHAHIEKEKQYNLAFKNGSCTLGDMDIKRHRNATYVNEYPCGNRCKDCGTFWID